MPGYLVKHETYHLGASSFEIRSLRDRQQYCDPEGEALAAGVSSAQWPLFGMVWPSARILAQAMQTLVLDGRRVLELGCGLGLASLVLHRRMGDITASDCHPLAGPFLAENLRLNGLPPMHYRTGHWGRSNALLGRFDVIIASDVLYERDHPRMLAHFIGLHANAQASVVVVDPDRGHRNAFCRQMQSLGFDVQVQRAPKQQNSGEPYKGQFLSFTRN
ncbi:MAG: SAM-dependent methyltransferase [Burkholderiales bacterium PBB4]|nr:MAG: SAM-dependent methyltransferase [Burkholderiales bacterium PBB4]